MNDVIISNKKKMKKVIQTNYNQNRNEVRESEKKKISNKIEYTGKKHKH